MDTEIFEVFEEHDTYFVRGTVYVIAILNRDTLKLTSYVERAFTSFEEAKEALSLHGEWSDIAYLIQAKEMVVPIQRGES